jgi:hypothetical protein
MPTATTTASTANTVVTIVTTDPANGAGGGNDTPPPVTTRGVDGSVNFENQSYNINVQENGEVWLFNKETMEHYSVSPTLNVDVDGERAFDFKGVTTLNLDDGTSVTITVQRRDEIDATRVVSTVIIVDGPADYAVQIKGLHVRDDDEALYFSETDKEGASDWLVQESNIIAEKTDGSGFVAIDEDGVVTPVDQAWIDETDTFIPLVRAIYGSYVSTSFSGLASVGYIALRHSSLPERDARLSENHCKPRKIKMRVEEADILKNSEARTIEYRRPDGSCENLYRERTRIVQFFIDRTSGGSV